MKRTLFLITIIGVLAVAALFSYAQDEDVAGRNLLIRQAKERQDTAVAVEAYLIGDILEVTIVAKMYAARPRIYNAILVGPRLGRISPKARQTLYPKAEDEELIFLTTDELGSIRFTKKTKQKEVKGTLTKELAQFKIPTDKIMPNKRYQLWIKVESMQGPGQRESFKFDLKNLSKLISEKD